METEATPRNGEDVTFAEAPAADPAADLSDSAPGDDAQVGLAAELAAAKALADERYAELQYARADIENVRKRAVRNAEDRLAASRRQLLGKFLPVLDNLQRALAFGDSQDLRGGLQATLKGFEALLASEGLTAVETIGKPFDPRVAEAVSTQDSEEHDDDVVLAELQPGYRIGDDLVRPAMVIVAKHVESAQAIPDPE